ncbi:exosome complex exonuclease rrp40 [Stylonychia lemnae]|uniref:Exosome complex exonuclease rrp40 n=1 Tax=Stylonychia lemnae TaxID=5949 RepID=A0A078A193_STYLE|nr:exosome complex exonuclease rrp40 [Stylonychia lemnae]|eukprot:CDW75253.1 exosome complex exonuclease rrp40 [Stylonychia lemnae]
MLIQLLSGQSFKLETHTDAFKIKILENDVSGGKPSIQYVATKSGILDNKVHNSNKNARAKSKNKMEIDIIPICSNRVNNLIIAMTLLFQYQPQENDVVIGTIVQKSPEFFTVDINSESYGILNTLEFQNSTRKDKPNYPEGTIVLCRVLKNERFAKTQLSCISLINKKAWNSGEAYFGELKSGYLKDFPISFCKSLLSSNQGEGILEKLGQKMQYEINIGYNGKIWLKTTKIQETIFIMQALERIMESGQSEENINFIINALK